VLSITLIRCDAQVFNGKIKEEIIDETDHQNYSQLLQKGYELNLHHSIILSLLIRSVYIYFLKYVV